MYFDKVSLRGHSSPKIKLLYWLNGEKVKVKLKMGEEVHTDIAASYLFELVGLNQDMMQYRSKVKFYLNGKTYEEFRALYTNKYGIEAFIRYIQGYGEDENGKWIEVKDVLLETRSTGELRISPIDISSWDLGNRREYRSLLLLWAWIGLHNTKPANFKFLYRPTKFGWIPLVRMQDPGNCLGVPLSLRNPLNAVGFFHYGTVNAFPSSFLKYKPREHVKITWNDLAAFKRYFKNTTWFDLKWMGRKIAALSSKDIAEVLQRSGMTAPVAEIFRVKLLKRRNQIVKAFGLENKLSHVPKLSSYNPRHFPGSRTIRNGKVKRRFFKDKNNLVHVPENLATVLSRLLVFDIPVGKWKNDQASFTPAIKGVRGLSGKLKIGDNHSSVTTIPLGIGIAAILSRSVTPNISLVNLGYKFNIYKITDKVKLKFDLDVPYVREMLEKINFIQGDINLKLFELEYLNIHFADKVSDAYFSKFILHKFIFNPAKFAAYNLKPMELLHVYRRYGFELAANVGANLPARVIENSLDMFGGTRKELSRYFFRDSYGDLHFFREKSKKNKAGAGLNILGVNLGISSLSFLNASFTGYKNTSEVLDYVITDNWGESKRRVNSPIKIDDDRRKKEYAILKKVYNGNFKNKSNSVKLSHKIKNLGKGKNSALGLLYIFNKNKFKSKSLSQVTGKTGESNYYLLLQKERSHTKGVPLAISAGDILNSWRTKTKITIEADLDDPQDFSLIVRNEDYYRVSSSKELIKLLNSLNWRFARPGQTFFDKTKLLKFNIKYRKVYGLIRVYVSGKKTIKKLKALDLDELKYFLLKHFRGKSKKISKILDLCKDIREMELNSVKSNVRILSLFMSLVDKLEVGVNGLRFLRLLNTGNIFVMGEIAGVLPSYSGLQDLQQLQRRRFMAKSWGEYKLLPTLQKYLRFHRYLAPSFHIEKIVSDNEIFGTLESGLPHNLEFLYQHESKF